jgi:P4 family phage/plasmid primase-like protien
MSESNDFVGEIDQLLNGQPTDSETPMPEPENKTDQQIARTETGNAVMLAAQYSTSNRYVPEINKWIHWNGVGWLVDPDTAAIDTAAKQIATSLPGKEQADAAHRKRSLSAQGISAMVRLVRSDPAMRISHDKLDNNAYQLNTPTGIVDLRTGKMIDHRPDAWHTKITGVGHDCAADCPEWKAFLNTTFENNQQLIDYVQAVIGYGAIGEVLVHILPFFWGAGNNGKSVLLETISGVLGNYAAPAPANFLLSGRDKHETEIAKLCGSRFVVCSEINQGTKFDEAKVKLLTGGDMLTGRFMRGDFFDFNPSHSLILVGNHQPSVAAGGHAFWRRVRLIPFTHQVPEEDRIEGLANLLIEEEGPAILSWIVDGARKALASDVVTPELVLAATEEYEESEDRIGRFLEDCTIQGTKDDRVLTSDLYQRYVDWCQAHGIKAILADSVFGREITSKGFQKTKTNDKRYVLGLRLRQPASGSRPTAQR